MTSLFVTFEFLSHSKAIFSHSASVQKTEIGSALLMVALLSGRHVNSLSSPLVALSRKLTLFTSSLTEKYVQILNSAPVESYGVPTRALPRFPGGTIVVNSVARLVSKNLGLVENPTAFLPMVRYWRRQRRAVLARSFFTIICLRSFPIDHFHKWRRIFAILLYLC